jgi:hypothetical protein
MLLHLLAHRAHMVRFEADPAITEFGLLRAFGSRGASEVRRTVATLESNRWVVRHTQYVIGYTEPKRVFHLTPLGFQKAQALARGESL